MMKKTSLLLVSLAAIISIKAQSNDETQWNAYKNIIPQYEKIDLSFSTSGSTTSGSDCLWSDYKSYTLSIKANYAVSFQFKGRDQYQYDYPKRMNDYSKETDCNASGYLKWNSENKQMEIHLTGNAYAKLTKINSQGYNEDITENISVDKTLNLYYDETRNSFYVDEIWIKTTKGVNIHIDKRATCSFGNKKTGLSTTDQFGEWQWNKDRSVIFLKSTMSNNEFQIVRPKETLSAEWIQANTAYETRKHELLNQLSDTIPFIDSLDLNDSINIAISNQNEIKRTKIKESIRKDSIQLLSITKYIAPTEKPHFILKLPQNAMGIKPQITEDGIPLDALELSFDGEAPNTFLFEKKENGMYQFVTYNRFLNEISYEATSIINQIAQKQTINVDYKLSSGEKKTEMFVLEGLETIMGYINR